MDSAPAPRGGGGGGGFRGRGGPGGPMRGRGGFGERGRFVFCTVYIYVYKAMASSH